MADGKTVTMREEGKEPITFKKNALHEQLHVPMGTKIPAEKREAALRGAYGSLAAKRARFAFKGALSQGRRTAAKR